MSERPSLPSMTMEELEEYLRVSAGEEASWRGIAELDVVNERQRWLARGRPATWLRRKWRELNGVDIPTYCRLSGLKPAQVRRAMRERIVTVLTDPFTGTPLIPLWIALAEGFSHEEVRRAARGESVHLTRLLRSALETSS